jgi:glutathione S-transferase
MSTPPAYTLYYWSVPFRGQFIRAILSHEGQSYDEPGDDQIGELMGKEPAEQPWPFTGPPLLIDNADGSALAQMPAIAGYLGDKFGLMPSSAIDRARTIKMVNDANDVIDELTLQGGVYRMWDQKLWDAFEPRLERWMAIFETTLERSGVGEDNGFLFGRDRPGVADIVTATLWGTMGDALDVTRRMLQAKAPLTAVLTERVNAAPALAALIEASAKRYEGQYCGGEIEKSLRSVAR